MTSAVGSLRLPVVRAAYRGVVPVLDVLNDPSVRAPRSHDLVVVVPGIMGSRLVTDDGRSGGCVAPAEAGPGVAAEPSRLWRSARTNATAARAGSGPTGCSRCRSGCRCSEGSSPTATWSATAPALGGRRGGRRVRLRLAAARDGERLPAGDLDGQGARSMAGEPASGGRPPCRSRRAVGADRPGRPLDGRSARPGPGRDPRRPGPSACGGHDGDPVRRLGWALELLAHGSGGPPTLSRRALREVGRTMPGLYDLLPTRACVFTGDTLESLEPSVVQDLGGDLDLAKASLAASVSPPSHTVLPGHRLIRGCRGSRHHSRCASTRGV